MATSTEPERTQIERVRLAPIGQQQWKLWADKICASWRKSVDAIVETGRVLNEAKDDLRGTGSFEPMIKSRLPFTPRTAQMLMEIARHPITSNPKHVSLLPASWGTLYQITRLPLRLVEECIEDGRINPKTERKDITALASSPRQRSTGGALDAPQPHPVHDEIGPDEELALLREFARFVIERANSVSVSPADHSEWKMLRDRLKAVLN